MQKLLKNILAASPLLNIFQTMKSDKSSIFPQSVSNDVQMFSGVVVLYVQEILSLNRSSLKYMTVHLNLTELRFSSDFFPQMVEVLQNFRLHYVFSSAFLFEPLLPC